MNLFKKSFFALFIVGIIISSLGITQKVSAYENSFDIFEDWTTIRFVSVKENIPDNTHYYSGQTLTISGQMETDNNLFSLGNTTVSMKATMYTVSNGGNETLSMSPQYIINPSNLVFTTHDTVSGSTIFALPVQYGLHRIKIEAKAFDKTEMRQFDFWIHNPSDIIINVWATPSTIGPGQSSMIHWQSSPTVGVACSNIDGTPVATSGNFSTGPLSVSTPYAFVCNNGPSGGISETGIAIVNVVLPSVSATAQSPRISGDGSRIQYSSTGSKSCDIYKIDSLAGIPAGGGGLHCPPSGSFYTGILTNNGTSNITTYYRITCGVGDYYNLPQSGDCNGPGASGNVGMDSSQRKFKFNDFSSFFNKLVLMDNVKSIFTKLVPKIFAEDITPSYQAQVDVGVTVTTSPPLVPQLIFNPSNIKDLVKAGSPPTIGSSQLMVTISGLNGSGKSCDLKNITSGVPIENYLTDKLNWLVDVSNLNTTNTFQIDCTGGIVSGTQTVLGQSGTLTPTDPNPICYIPIGSSSCKIKTNWSTTNPQTISNAQVASFFSGATATPAVNGTNVDTTITSAPGSTVPRTAVISIYNKVDKEGNSQTVNNSDDNQLASLATLVKCATGGSWNSTNGICEPAGITVEISADPAGTTAQPIGAPGATNLYWTMSGNPTSCDADGPDWSGTNIKNGDPVTHRSGMPAKTYIFKIKCYKGALVATDEVEVKVDASTGNLPPVVNAGPDRAVVNGNSVQIANGAASATDPEGGTVDLLWTRVSGPNSPTITNGTTLTPTFGGVVPLIVGIYEFELKGTDNLGQKGYDQMKVTVTALGGGAVPTISILKDPDPIASQTATLHLNITNKGTPATLSERGTCISKTPAGLTNCEFEQKNSNVPSGIFEHTRSGLDPGTTYYYRGYAINATGTGYTTIGSFSTSGDLTVNANPTSYTVEPSTLVSFTYTTSTNYTSGGAFCRLLDYNQVPLTDWVASTGTITYSSPSNNDFGPYSYYIRCRDKNYTNIVGTSSEIKVTVEDSTASSSPDLVASETWPTSVYTGTTSFYSTILNVGAVGTGGQFRNRFQVSTKEDGSNAVNYDTIDLMEPIESGDSKMAERAINFGTAGTYYMRACADLPPANPGAIPEGLPNEGNNCSPWVEVIVYDSQPDLIASIPAPTEVTTGNTTFYADITNQGNGGTVSNFTNRFQVSTTANGSNIIGTYTDEMAALGPYITGGTSAVINFPTAGTFYIQACADLPPNTPGKVTNESDETNNCSGFVPITVYTSYPDLVISNTNPTDPTEMWTGDTTFYASVTNVGETTTGFQFKNRFQVSTEPDGGGTITNHDTGFIGPLGVYITGGTSAVINFPNPGTFYMRACTDIPPDSPGVIPESDEDTNCSADWLPVTIQPIAAGIDLTASTTYPTNVPTGATTFYSNITNGGASGTILAFYNKFQVSTTPDSSNVIGTYPTTEMSALASVSTEGTSKSINFPNLGTYYMRACADLPPDSPGTIINETDEDNNCSGWVPVYVEECANGATNYPACTGGDPSGLDGECGNIINSCNYGVPTNKQHTQTADLWTCDVDDPGIDKACSIGNGNPGGDGDLTLTALPTWIFKGRSSTLTWTSNADVGTCIGDGFDTEGQPSGSAKVTPEKTTIYTISGCMEAGVDLGSVTTKVRVINPLIIEI